MAFKSLAIAVALVCCLSASVYGQVETVSRTAAAATERIGGIRGLVSNIRNNVRNNDSDRPDDDDCRDCSALGHLDNFNYPLYNDCDVAFLESLFDPEFEFDVEGLASVIATIPNGDPEANPLAFSFAAGPSGGNFTLTFEEIDKIIFPNVGNPIGHGAPTFLAIFSGSGPPVPPASMIDDSFRDFLQPFLCTLLPTGTGATFARADCVASLDPLTEQGFVPIVTLPADPPTQTFTLSARLDESCRSDDLNFVGSDVVPGELDFDSVVFSQPDPYTRRRSLNGNPLMPEDHYYEDDYFPEGPVPVNQQVVLTGTRVFAK